MRLAVLKERAEGETRVAAVPETVRKLLALGVGQVVVESGAGLASGFPDQQYTDAGAEIASDPASALAGAGILLAVQVPPPEVRDAIPPGTLLVCVSGAATDPALAEDLARRRIDVAAMELLPRITRAQSMDVLSSQANLAGYRAVIEAAGAFERGFAMMMTAAGTVPPARVLVLGAGVAGLQAIATARRLGAIVSATDVRPAAKEEIKSLGANFVGVEDTESAGQTGPYAGQMSADFLRRQNELVAQTAAKGDIVICTALVQGRKAPVLLSEEAVAGMKPGSVVVDLAADNGGNCAATVPGQAITTPNGVKVLGWRNWPARIATAASSLYARNLLTFLALFWHKEQGRPHLPADDEIVQGVMLTREGAVVHPRLQPATPTPAEAPSATAAASIAPAPIAPAAAASTPAQPAA
jgi:H+-translocating NAD(P) transhydrogenase subunit alpha